MAAEKTGEKVAVALLTQGESEAITELQRRSIQKLKPNFGNSLLNLKIYSLQDTGDIVNFGQTLATKIGVGGMNVPKKFDKIVDSITHSFKYAIARYEEATKIDNQATKRLQSLTKEAQAMNKKCREILARTSSK